MEIWLRTNPRPFWIALVIPAALAIAGAGCLLSARALGAMWPYGWGGVILIVVGAMLAGMLLWRAYSPVLAIQGADLQLFIGSAPPIAIPLEIVECFFTGQGDTLMKDRAGKDLEEATVILRLAEAAKEWHHRDVPPSHAHWCEGYVTLRGAWCEPIKPELLRSLNQRLVAAQRRLKTTPVKASQP